MSPPATVPPEDDPRVSPVSITDPLMHSPAIREDYTCYLCGHEYKSPKILNCLHVFCQPCLEENLTSKPSDHLLGHLTCPQCQQDTLLPSKDVSDLPSDLVMVDMLDKTAIQERHVICTSCKAREKAVARCTDCGTFLCPNCVTAHQYMRCFDNHKVVSFDEFSTDDNFVSHKLIFCDCHPSEFMNFFCCTCQVPVCNECIIGGLHAQGEHMTEKITVVETRVKDELKMLLTESKAKLQYCEEATSVLQNNLSDVQMHRDDAKSLIQETFQTYKAMLENRQEEMLAELEALHSTQELSIMEHIHQIDRTVSRIEDGCQFTGRILEKGNGVEILQMKNMIYTQLLAFINNTPKAAPVAKIEFFTDTKHFREVIRQAFGSFKKGVQPLRNNSNHSEPTSTIHSPLQSSFENDRFSLPSGILRDDDHGAGTNDFAHHLQNIPMALNVPITHQSPPNLTSIPPHIEGTAITGLTESVRSYSRNSHSPAMSDSGVSLDASSGGSGNNTPQISIATLAKMGNLSINKQGLISLNGQLLPGFNINNLPQFIHKMPEHPPTPTSVTANIGGHSDASPAADLDTMVSSTDNIRSSPSMDLESLGGTSKSIVTSSMVATSVQPPTLDTLATLLHQQAATAGATSPSGNQINTFMPAGSSSGTLTPTSGMFNSIQSPCGSILGSTSGMTGIGMPEQIVSDVIESFDTSDSQWSENGQNGAQNPPFQRRAGKVSAMQIRCKFGQLGPGKGQFNSPHGFCMGLDEDIIVADTNNHRIQIFEKTGEFKYQFGIPGREEGQLWYPRKVAVMRNSGKFVVCDRGNERSRMQIFSKNGHFIKKIAIRYIDIVAGLAITPQGHIVAVDSVSPTVFCIAESGDLIRWFDCSDYMREPSDIAIAGKEYFVCDFKGHCVVVFSEEGQFLRRIGCENITNFPNGIDISDAGDVLIGDSHGNRFHVAVFQRDGSIIGEFECPYVKVSRCCGLNITGEGYIVTLAKNNHHVLVLNTLYIT